MIDFVPTSSYPRGVAFPPHHGVARAAVDGKRVREATSRWIAYACAVALALGQAGVLEAYRVLTDVVSVAGRRFASARVCAAANTGAVLSRSGTRSHLLVVQHELRTVEGSGDAAPCVVDGLIYCAAAVDAALRALRVSAPLRWLDDEPVMVPATPLAAERVEALPTTPIEGTWAGVRGVLRNHGLEPIGDSFVGEVVRVERLGLTLRVTDIEVDELLERYAPAALAAGGAPASAEGDEDDPTDEDLAAIEMEPDDVEA